MWHNDASGNLVFDRVLKAADRRVRVWPMVDDFWLAANVEAIAAASRHPNLDFKI